MSVPTETQLVTLGTWTLRERRGEGEAPRLLLMIHGWTGDENSMWVFGRNLPASYWVLAPRAPYVTKPSGYTWRAPEPGQRETPTFTELRSAAAALISFADAYARQQDLPPKDFDLMGFSQGAGLACTMALLFPERIGKIGLLAGFVPEGAEPLIAQRPLTGKDVFVAHGTQDEMVPFSRAQRSVQLLQDAGARVILCTDDVGHKVSAACLRALHSFFA